MLNVCAFGAVCVCFGLQFEKELEDPKYKAAGEVRVHKVSHVGGHKYAGNVLVYGPKTLDWYAYVRQTDVAEVCEKVQGLCTRAFQAVDQLL